MWWRRTGLRAVLSCDLDLRSECDLDAADSLGDGCLLWLPPELECTGLPPPPPPPPGGNIMKGGAITWAGYPDVLLK